MISPETRVQIRRYFFAEHWEIGTIALALDVHPHSVRRAIGVERCQRAEPLRRSMVDPYVPFVRQVLEQHPRLRATRLYHMIRDRGYAGSVEQLRRVVARLRPQPREAFLRLQVFPAEQAQVDWAYFGSVMVGRAKRQLSCFVITLSWSRVLYLELFFDQTTENFLRGHVRAFQDWSGAPRVILYDNLRSAVLERRGDQIHFNPRLLELAAHYHFVPRPCQVRAGNQKGRVERAIRYVRDSFWAGRVFTTLADCNRQALLWRDEVAHQRRWPDDSARSVAEAFAEEQPRLLPLPLHSFNTDRIEPVRSRKTIYVHFDLNDYSIPPEAVGRPLTLVASDTDIRILDGAAEIARHPRSYDRQQSILDPAHEQALLRTKRKASTKRARAAWRWPFRKAKTCWNGPSPRENRPPAKPHNCCGCWTCTGWPLCAASCGKPWSGTRRAPPRSPSCCAEIAALRPCRRWISAAIRRLRPSRSVPTIWRLTMNSRTRTTTTPSNSLAAQLEQIGLHALAGEVDDFLARATKQRWSPRQILEHLAQSEAAERAHRSLERRLRLSEIKKFKPMADYDWSWPTKIEREVIERALTLDFLPEARNLILVGTNGLGKTRSEERRVGKEWRWRA